MKYYDAYYCVGCHGFIKNLTSVAEITITKELSFNSTGKLETIVSEEATNAVDFACFECGCAIMDYRVTKEVIDILIERWKISSVFPCRHINKDRKNEKEVITLSKLMEHLL